MRTPSGRVSTRTFVALTHLYRFYGEDRGLLYVGITADFPDRYLQHRSDKPWFSEVRSMTLESFDTLEEARSAERAAIEAESPLYNWPHQRAIREQGSQEWCGAHEIGDLLNVSRQRVYQLTSRPGFPEPMVRLRAGAVWRTEDVVAWARARGRGIVEEEGAS